MTLPAHRRRSGPQSRARPPVPDEQWRGAFKFLVGSIATTLVLAFLLNRETPILKMLSFGGNGAAEDPRLVSARSEGRQLAGGRSGSSSADSVAPRGRSGVAQPAGIGAGVDSRRRADRGSTGIPGAPSGDPSVFAGDAGGPGEVTRGGTGRSGSPRAGSGAGDAATPPAEESARAAEAGRAFEVASLRLSAGGSALDFRYRVLDSGLADKVGRHGGATYILDANGQKISPRNVQPIGEAYRNRHLDNAGRTYATLFANQGRAIKSGDVVTVVMGDYQVANVRVE